ncbi:hypothetical protein [Flavicella sediminum]|uniref:hypothetical protein n=1 Tax=Flavicella sediminum TaxID=2585141 RepID=UPI0011212DD7|nr:hypothetical protein [Flavicella sediminum]
MDIQAEKLELMKLLLNTENPSILESIKNILRKEKTSDFWDELSAEQKEEIKNADLEISRGETVSYDNFMSSHR